MSNTVINEYCSIIEKFQGHIDIEQLRISLDVFVSVLKETNNDYVKCMLIEQIISSMAKIPYRSTKLVESNLITHEFFIILRDDILIKHLHRRRTEQYMSSKLMQNVSVLFMNLYYNINETNTIALKQLLFHQPLIDELKNCLEEIGVHGQHFNNTALLRSVRYLLLTFKHCLKNEVSINEQMMIEPIYSTVIQCLLSSYAVAMVKSLKQNFFQKLDDTQTLFLDTIPLYLQWHTDYGSPERFIDVIRNLLNEFTTWLTNCQLESYLHCTNQFGGMLRHLSYFLIRPVQSESMGIFSEEFYPNYCKLVLYWSSILSSTITQFSETTNVRKHAIRIIIQNLYNFTLHLNVLNYMKTISTLIPMLLKVTAIEDDEIQLNVYRCLGKIMMETDIKTMTNPSKIAAVYIDFITNTINHPHKKERFHSLLKSLKNFVQHDQVKTELLTQDALPLLVKCVIETQFDPTKVQQVALEILLALSFNSDASCLLRQNQNLIDHVRTLVYSTTTVNLGLQRAAEGLLWKLEDEKKAVAQSTLTNLYKYDLMISYSHKDQQICLQINEQLVKDGVNVWFDRDCLRGSTMVGIANAIENSKNVLICMSNTYKQSVYCHSEAHYAFERGCRLIPIIVEPNYKPDGWLGIIVSGKIYVDFGNVDFKLAYEKLKDEITEQRQLTSNQSSLTSEETIIQADSTFSSSDASQTVSQSIVNLPNCITQWTHDHVKSFLLQHGLSKTILPLLFSTDGPRVLQLYEMCLINRESMYQSLKFELNDRHHTLLPIADYLTFLHEIQLYVSPTPKNVKPTQYSFLSLTFCNIL